MAQPCRYVLFLLWLSYLIVASILLFTRGFLLNKIAQETNSSCTLYQEELCSNEPCQPPSLMNGLHSAASVCLPRKARVVLIVIDALRYDFALFDDKIKEELAYQNKMPVINKLRKEHPSSTRLYKFVADPPTTTMQRLKALTTGSLPTFVDAGSNFATAEINEDNLIDQLVRHHQQVVFMGDDTWTSLFPKRFLRSYAYPSFNVFDLDTVDDGVLQNLYPELANKDWSLLVGHFLGVDHCGHRYGPLHSEMTRKLNEMNSVIENVVERMPEDAMLFVIGDHGMTSNGDHGGDSSDEVASAMFVYSKAPLTSMPFNNNTVKQIDLVPTLATILGVPIPYSNLGSVITNNLPSLDAVFRPWELILFTVWSNVQQMTHYIKEYASTSQTFNQARLQNTYERFAILNARVRTVSASDYTVFVEDALDYMRMLREMCEEVWVQFDSFSMSRGLLLLFMTAFLVYMIVSIPGKQLIRIFDSSFLWCSLAVLALATLSSFACHYFELVDNLFAGVLFATGASSVALLLILVIQNWDLITLRWYNASKNRSFVEVASRIVFVFSWCGLFSNSYIVEEGYVSLFLLVTMVVLLTYQHKKFDVRKLAAASKHKLNTHKLMLLFVAFIVMVFVRFSVVFWRCREEQQWCFLALDASQQAKYGSKLHKAEYLLTLVMVAVFVTVTRNWLKSCGNLVGFSFPTLLLRYGPTLMVVSMGGYWVLRDLPKNATVSWQPAYLAWTVYGCGLAGLICLILRPLRVYVIPSKADLPNASSIPEIFRFLKGLFSESVRNETNVPIICGLGTVYSSSFIALTTYASLVLMLVLGKAVASSVVLAYFAAIGILAVVGIVKLENAQAIGQLFDVSNSSVYTWMLFSLYFFYGSHHQATFPTIAWDAAFIGTDGVFTSNVVPAALVIVNTFSSYILAGLMLPLLFVAPFTVHVMMPWLCSKKDWKDLVRGELVLYENDAAVVNGVFVLAVKYILCHAVRVFVSMLSATIHCRHLMVWKIFAPKLIFEMLGLLATLVSVLFGYLFLIYVNFNVDLFVAALGKKSR